MPFLFFHVMRQEHFLEVLVVDLLLVELKTVVHQPNLRIIATVEEGTASIATDLQPRQMTSKAACLNIYLLALRSDQE